MQTIFISIKKTHKIYINIYTGNHYSKNSISKITIQRIQYRKSQFKEFNIENYIQVQGPPETSQPMSRNDSPPARDEDRIPQTSQSFSQTAVIENIKYKTQI